jgi:YfiR/HmsC-like
MSQVLNRRRPPGRRSLRGPSLAWVAAAVSVALAIAGPVRAAEEMSLAPNLQIPILLKILTYDRHFLSRYGTEFTFGVLYAPADPESVKAANAVADYMYQARGKTVKGLPLSYYLLEYTTPEGLERSIATRGIDVLYVAPGNAKNLAAITKVSQDRGITTTTGIPDYVRSGVAVGVAQSQGHLQYLVNLTSARAEGAEFDASLLRISTIVK